MKKLFVIAFLIFAVSCFAQETKGTIKVKKVESANKDTIQVTEGVEPVVLIIEQMPSFPGGDVAMQKFLSQNIQYPAMELEMGVQGKVYVAFVVDVDGSLTDIKLMRGVKDGPGCDKEAMRVVKMMPKWVPAKKEGKPVKTKINLPINFKIS